MPTIEVQPIRPPETWEEWMRDWPPGKPPRYLERLLTRDELIDTLTNADKAEDLTPQGGRVGMTVNELRYLESIGVLPRPVRRWHNGAVRAVYPGWVTFLVMWLRVLQGHGLSLKEIGPWLRKNAALIARGDFHESRTFSVPAAGGVESVLPANLRRELGRLARHHARLTGVATTRVEVRVVDAEGRETHYNLPLPENEK